MTWTPTRYRPRRRLESLGLGDEARLSWGSDDNDPPERASGPLRVVVGDRTIEVARGRPSRCSRPFSASARLQRGVSRHAGGANASAPRAGRCREGRLAHGGRITGVYFTPIASIVWTPVPKMSACCIKTTRGRTLELPSTMESDGKVREQMSTLGSTSSSARGREPFVRGGAFVPWRSAVIVTPISPGSSPCPRPGGAQGRILLSTFPVPRRFRMDLGTSWCITSNRTAWRRRRSALSSGTRAREHGYLFATEYDCLRNHSLSGFIHAIR